MKYTLALLAVFVVGLDGRKLKKRGSSWSSSWSSSSNFGSPGSNSYSHSITCINGVCTESNDGGFNEDWNDDIFDGWDNVQVITPTPNKPKPPVNQEKPKPAKPSKPKGRCGRPKVSPIGNIAKIVGGTVAKPGSWPWQVSLQTSSGGHHYCGGSIISSYWILTASHCIDDVARNPSSTVIRVGAFDLKKDGKNYAVQKAYFHPKWNSKTLANDIALIKLKQPIRYSKKVQRVCLPSRDKSQVEKTNVKLTVTGWGALNSASWPISPHHNARRNVVCNQK